MTWERGRRAIERLIEEDEMERVVPSDTLAGRLMDDGVAHLASARAIAGLDPAGAFQLAYDAARKACTALLAVQGLRPTSRGGHRALQDAVREQFGPVFAAFDRMRRRRRDSEYPDSCTPTITRDDADEGIEKAEAMLKAARELLDSGQVPHFR
jgi:hypothetical protein